VNQIFTGVRVITILRGVHAVYPTIIYVPLLALYSNFTAALLFFDVVVAYFTLKYYEDGRNFSIR
jgi:hypothetical protein